MLRASLVSMLTAFHFQHLCTHWINKAEQTTHISHLSLACLHVWRSQAICFNSWLSSRIQESTTLSGSRGRLRHPFNFRRIPSSRLPVQLNVASRMQYSASGEWPNPLMLSGLRPASNCACPGLRLAYPQHRPDFLTRCLYGFTIHNDTQHQTKA